MSKYKAGVAGPISLEDGRVVTAEQGPFDLDLPELEEGEFSHDHDLLERGVIVLVVEPEPEAKAPDAKTQPAQPTSRAAGATPAASGQKAGE